MEDYKKKYEEIVKKIKETKESMGGYTFSSVVDKIIPELKESEDERIRKALIHYFSEQDGILTAINGSVSVGDILAWLKKQGKQKPIIEGTFVDVDEVRENFMQEVYRVLDADSTNDRANQIIDAFDHLPTITIQKPTDKVEPKFKVGDWIYHEISGNTIHINKIENGLYVSDEGATISLGRQDNWRIWTIQDAKDGDVLCDYFEKYNNPLIFILKKFEHVNFGLVRPSDYSSYCFLTAGDRQKFEEGSYHHKCNIKPATKEQRDQLEKAMKEAGYEWDAKKKELKKIEQKPVVILKFRVGDTIKNKKTNKIFTISDYSLLYEYYHDINHYHEIKFSEQDDWELVEQKSTWSEEDEKYYDSALWHIKNSCGIEGNIYNWLKSLRERMKGRIEL